MATRKIRYTKQNVVVYRAEIGNYRIFIGPTSLARLNGMVSLVIYRGEVLVHQKREMLTIKEAKAQARMWMLANATQTMQIEDEETG